MHNIRRIGLNAVSLLASDIANRATMFVIYTLIARYLGAYAFGQLSLALTFFQTCQLFALVGLQTLITREVAKDKSTTSTYFMHGNIIVIFFSALSISVLFVITQLLHYPHETTSIILLLSFSLFPYAVTVVIDALFQAWEKMSYISYASFLVNIIRIICTFLLLSQGYNLYTIILLLLISHIVNMLVKLWFLFRCLTKIQCKFDVRFTLRMVKVTNTFLGINGAQAVLTSVNIILLSKLASEVDVALFSASEQVLVPVALMFESVSRSIFPVMCQRLEPGEHGIKALAEQVIKLSIALVLPATVGLFFLADSVAILLYGHQDFTAAGVVLRIVVWHLVSRVFTQVLGQVLIAHAHEKVTLRILCIDVVVMLVLAPLLIAQFGVVGAAMASLAVRLVDFLQHYLPVSRMLGGLAIGRLLWKPALASAVMALYLVATGDQGLLLTIPPAALLYGLVLVLLTLWRLGGVTSLKTKYEYLLSK